ncbi:hypothetical protein AVEN_118187-1 [Araneus ventricosus]|uniref:RNase H type-1 domain-containing protein n=1 Tax=Araneus ventricosus TaxID=182803 RepID=A0A4Y2JZD4_ARAVE|nr:hypothetical protein AVEN_118187-1 [Araneus ventricosus]
MLLVNPQIKLNWVRAHVGIYGNELADSSAKNATTKEEVDIKVKIPKSWIKNQFKATMLQEWQARWGSSFNSRFLYGNFSRGKYKKMPRRLFDKPDSNNSWVFPCCKHRIFCKSPDCECRRDKELSPIIFTGARFIGKLDKGIFLITFLNLVF